MMKVNNPDSNIFDANNETECRKQCLNSSLCQAYSFQPLTDICWIWTENLSNLQEEYINGGRNLFVRVAKSVIGTPFTPWINSVAKLKKSSSIVEREVRNHLCWYGFLKS